MLAPIANDINIFDYIMFKLNILSYRLMIQINLHPMLSTGFRRRINSNATQTCQVFTVPWARCFLLLKNINIIFINANVHHKIYTASNRGRTQCFIHDKFTLNRKYIGEILTRSPIRELLWIVSWPFNGDVQLWVAGYDLRHWLITVLLVYSAVAF